MWKHSTSDFQSGDKDENDDQGIFKDPEVGFEVKDNKQTTLTAPQAIKKQKPKSFSKLPAENPIGPPISSHVTVTSRPVNIKHTQDMPSQVDLDDVRESVARNQRPANHRSTMSKELGMLQQSTILGNSISININEPRSRCNNRKTPAQPEPPVPIVKKSKGAEQTKAPKKIPAKNTPSSLTAPIKTARKKPVKSTIPIETTITETPPPEMNARVKTTKKNSIETTLVETTPVERAHFERVEINSATKASKKASIKRASAKAASTGKKSAPVPMETSAIQTASAQKSLAATASAIKKAPVRELLPVKTKVAKTSTAQKADNSKESQTRTSTRECKDTAILIESKANDAKKKSEKIVRYRSSEMYQNRKYFNTRPR